MPASFLRQFKFPESRPRRPERYADVASRTDEPRVIGEGRKNGLGALPPATDGAIIHGFGFLRGVTTSGVF